MNGMTGLIAKEEEGKEERERERESQLSATFSCFRSIG